MSEPPLDEPAGTPRWVKVAGVITVVFVVLIVVLIVSGGGHGPSRHSAAEPTAQPS